MRKDIITISRGPQFNDGYSFILFFLIIFLLIFVIMLFGYNQYLFAILLSLISGLLLFNMLDIQGVQIDKKNKLIRNYKIRLWGKTGKWSGFNKYRSVFLDFKTYHIKTRSIFTELITEKQNYHNRELHGHFLILLIHKNENKSLILGEIANYKNAKVLAEKYAREICLPMRNIIKERIQLMKNH